MPPRKPQTYAQRQAQQGEADDWLTRVRPSKALEMIIAQGSINREALGVIADRVARDERLADSVTGFRVVEPLTYDRHSPHSFFRDLLSLSTGLGDRAAAEKRLEKHDTEMAVHLPRWREARAAAALRAYEDQFASDWRGQQALERMERLGVKRFAGAGGHDRRAANTTAASGGRFVPPLWLAEDYVNAPRAGRPLADLVTVLPLALHTGFSVNVPRWTAGLGAAPQTADGAAVVAANGPDSYSTSLIRTTAGLQDVSAQFAEQTPEPGADRFIFSDLLASIDASLDAQLILGSGVNGQLAGIVPGGSADSTKLCVTASTNSDTTQTLTTSSASGTPAWSAVPRLFSLMAKARGKGPTHLLVSPGLQGLVAAGLDTTGRPILLPSADPPEPGQLVSLWGHPALVHEGMPDTWGGTTPPSVSVSGTGVSAVTDGNGGYAAVIALRPSDLVLFSGEVQTAVMKEVLGGTLQWRFVARQYNAFLRDRYASASALSATNGGDVTGTASAGASAVAGIFTNYESTSPLQPAANGF